jgi:hypothetical protein
VVKTLDLGVSPLGRRFETSNSLGCKQFFGATVVAKWSLGRGVPCMGPGFALQE